MLSLEQARAWYPQNDPVHGFDHIERVYALALRLAEAEDADSEIVAAAALLHDAQDPLADAHGARLEHHQASAAFARQVLAAQGWDEQRIAAVEHCIRAHRFRDDREPPATLEAQVLFDADKLDAIGLVGVARAVAYAARAGQPAYAQPSLEFLAGGTLAEGEPHSAYHEYLFKLRRLQERLFTAEARRIGAARHAAMQEYFERLALEWQGQA